MKLLFCPDCYDVRRIHRGETVCNCGHSIASMSDMGKVSANAVPEILYLDTQKLRTGLHNWGAGSPDRPDRITYVSTNVEVLLYPESQLTRRPFLEVADASNDT